MTMRGTVFGIFCMSLCLYAKSMQWYSEKGHAHFSVFTGRCEDMVDVTSVKLSNVGLQQIGAEFLDSPYVHCLFLNDNQIFKISQDAFKNAPNLEFLDLSGNEIPIEQILSLTGLSKLKTLVVDNYLRTDWYESEDLDINDTTFPGLEHLYVRRRSITTRMLGSLLSAAPNLTHLYLSENPAGVNWNFSKSLPKTLTHLYLDWNNIEGFGNGNLQNIVELALDGNNIGEVCTYYCKSSSISLKDMRALRKLSLSNNQITAIDADALFYARNLTSLDLSMNKIQNIATNAFDALMAMQNLSIAHNVLTAIPNLCPMSTLESVNLSGNLISVISNELFCEMRMLKNLYLAGNVLSHIEAGTFTALPSLEVLDLSDNRFNQLPENWFPMHSNLRTLLVKNNSFQRIGDVSAFNLRLLTDLHVEGNPIVRLEAQILTHFQANLTVHLAYECNSNNIVRLYG